MKITQVETIRFKTITNTERDSDGHGHPGPERETTQTLLQIDTDEGVSGYWFGANAQVIDSLVKPAISAKTPFTAKKSGATSTIASASIWAPCPTECSWPLT